MESLSLKTENTQTSHQNPSTNNNKLLGILFLATPLICFLIILIYYLISSSEIGTAFSSSIAVFVTLLLIYQILISLSHIFQIIFSLQATRRNVISRRINSRFTLVDSPKTQPVSIIIWAYNQGYSLAETIKSVLALNYPDYEIIVINDGSTDSTLEVLETEFGLQPLNRIFRRAIQTSPITATYTSPKYPIISVIEKPHTGRTDSLNIGLNLAKAPLVCIIEPNHLLTRDALLLLAKPFIEQPATTIMTAGLGETKVNFEDSLLSENLSLVEKKHLFHSNFLLRNAFCLVASSNNAIRLIKKAELVEIGGFSSTGISDLSLNLQLQEILLSKGRSYRFYYIPEILCWENDLLEMPKPSELHREWQKNTLSATTGKIKLLAQSPLNKHFWAYSLLLAEITFPLIYLLTFVLTPICYLTGVISLELLILYAIIIVFSLLESLSGIIADELSLRCQHTSSEIINLILASLVEGSIYQPLINYWRLLGCLRSLSS